MIQTLVTRRNRTIGGCLTATPSRAGYAGSRTASSASRALGVAGCGGSGVFGGVELADATRSALDLPVLPIPR
jgi:hypothetical protein